MWAYSLSSAVKGSVEHSSNTPLAGFFQAGLQKAYLEVTAQNNGVVQLYRDLGFRREKTLYKAISE